MMPPTMSSHHADDQSSAAWLRRLAANVDYSRFRKIWLHPITEQAEQGYLAACYERVAQRAISEGEYFLAHDAANHGLRCAATAEFPPHTLTALKVTALARSGATGEAKKVLEQFLAHHDPDSIICSAQARLFRDLSIAATGTEERQRTMREAARWATRAKEHAIAEGADWAYPANQEALFRFLAGEREPAREQARALIASVESRPDAGTMWNQINLAEMHLVGGNLAAAGRHYEKAAEIGAGSPGDVAANRAVAEVLMRELTPPDGIDGALLDCWFPKPVFVVFAGHIPDERERPRPRLPETLCRPDGPAARAIAERLGRIRAVEGICASAPGGDILFAEAITRAGARLALIDPFPRNRIEKVAAERGHDWPKRLAGVFAAAVRSETIACAEDADETAQCEYANHVMLGAALLRARRINAKLHAMALWDEADADSPSRGGTGQFVALCRKSGAPVEIINPLKLSI